MRDLTRTSVAVLLMFSLFVSCGDDATGGSNGPVLAAEADDATVFGEVPVFRLTAQTGAEVTRDTLAGQPFAVAAIFTRCAGPCPRITARLRALQDELEGTDVRLVSVSVDPEYDTPEVLATYAGNYTADDERWLFLTGTEPEVEAFLKDGLWLPLARAEGAVAPGERVTHSTKVVAVDRNGRLRGWYDVLQEDESERLLERLLRLADE